ncbi:MAG: RidA family protein [Proteobacteria bacterium]|nr:RidA family protein [Pseudomonadota bacterium]
MARRNISQGSKFEELAGYSRAVVDDPWVFVSGTTGFDYAAGTISDDITEQTEQIFRNLNWALKEAGASLDDVVRVRVYLAAAEYFKPVAAVLGREFASVRPTNTTVVTDLVYPTMKVEIEVTAKKRDT